MRDLDRKAARYWSFASIPVRWHSRAGFGVD